MDVLFFLNADGPEVGVPQIDWRCLELSQRCKWAGFSESADSCFVIPEVTKLMGLLEFNEVTSSEYAYVYRVIDSEV